MLVASKASKAARIASARQIEPNSLVANAVTSQPSTLECKASFFSDNISGRSGKCFAAGCLTHSAKKSRTASWVSSAGTKPWPRLRKKVRTQLYFCQSPAEGLEFDLLFALSESFQFVRENFATETRLYDHARIRKQFRSTGAHDSRGLKLRRSGLVTSAPCPMCSHTRRRLLSYFFLFTHCSIVSRSRNKCW